MCNDYLTNSVSKEWLDLDFEMAQALTQISCGRDRGKQYI